MPEPRTFYPAPRGEVRAQARERGAQWAAVTAGVVEGILEGLERYELARNADEAMHAAGDLTRAVASEGRAQAKDPVLQEVGRDVQQVAETAWDKTTDAAETAQQQAQETLHTAKENVTHWVDEARANVTERVDEAKDKARWSWMKVQMAAKDTWHTTLVRGRAVGETGHRAVHAPRLVAKDVGQAVTSWRKGVMSSMGMYVVAGVVALATFVVLTIAVVTGMNALIGAPAGTFVAAGIYALATIGVVYGAKKAKENARKKAAQHMADAKQQLRDVVRPLQIAFQKDLEEYKNG